MRNFLIFLSFLSFAGCDLLDSSSVILTNDTGKDSVLDTLFSSSQILPPSDINYYPEEDGAGFAVTVYWADSPTAVGYNVYVAASENGTYYKVNGDPLVEPVYRLPAYTFTEDAGEIRQYVKISSVSGSGKESPLSPCVETLISNESEFTGGMESFSLSKGTARTIEFSFSPAADAFSYEIYRRVNGSAEDVAWECVNDLFIPYNNTDPTIVYLDSTAEEGIIYDYGVVACDRYGKKSPMYTVEIGYVLPAPYDLEVVGLPAVENGNSGDQKQTLELTWKLNMTMKNAVSEFVLGRDTEPLGTSVFPLPEYNDDGWVISVLMEPGNPEFKPLRNVLSPAFTEADDTEHGLKLLDKWEGEINDGFEKSGNYWHKEENGVLTVRYLLSVEPPPSGEGEYNYRWGSLFYFKVKAVYENGNQVREYESPESSLFGGYVVDPSGPKAEDDGRTLYDPSISGSGTDLSVYLTVATPNGSSPAGAQINIYRRTPEDIQYTLVNKEPLKVSGQDVSVTDTNVFGYDYIDYRFEYVEQDGKRSCLSGKKTVIIQ